MNQKTDAFVRLHISILLAGATGCFGRFISLSELPLVWYRVMLGALTLAVVLGIQGALALPKGKDLLKIMGCGVLLSVHWVFFYGSIKAANVSIGVVCFALVGFFTAILEPLIGRHRPSWRELLLSLITVSGIVLIFGLDARYRHGIMLGVVSSLLYSLFSISSKQVQSSTGKDSSTMLLYELVGGIVVLTAVVGIRKGIDPSLSLMPVGNDWWLLPLLATVFTVVTFVLQLQSLRHISAFTVNLSYNLEPIYSIILAAIFFGEAREVGLPFWIGVTLILASVALQTILTIKKNKIS